MNEYRYNLTLYIILHIIYNMSTKKSLNVEDDPIFEEFCNNRGLSERTRFIYTGNLQKYIDYTGMSLTDLLDEAEKEEDLNLRYRKRKINKYLNDFKLHLDSLDYSHAYKTQITTQVKAFYNEFDIQLPKSKYRKSRKSRKTETIDELPTMKEIKKFLNHCNSCYKAIVTLALSSGMGRAEIASLTFKHLYDALEIHPYPNTISEALEKITKKGNFIPTWNIKRVKTDNPYFTFSSPENLEMIIDYLDELTFKHPEFKPKPNDTLFRTLRINTPLRPKPISTAMHHINMEHGFRKKTNDSGNNFYILYVHSLRKYFATTLEKNKVPHLVTRWLLGHSLDGTTGAYFKADPDTLKEDYLEVVNELSIKDIEVKSIDSPEYKELKEMYENDSKAKDKEIARMNRELELIKQMLNDGATRKELDKREASS